MMKQHKWVNLLQLPVPHYLLQLTVPLHSAISTTTIVWPPTHATRATVHQVDRQPEHVTPRANGAAVNQLALVSFINNICYVNILLIALVILLLLLLFTCRFIYRQ